MKREIIPEAKQRGGEIPMVMFELRAGS